jgi:hypothetical protein
MAKKAKACCAQPSSMMDDKYQAEDDARTLTRAQEVRQDAKRHKRAMEHLNKQATTNKQAADLEKKVSKALKTAFTEEEE